MGIMPTMFLGTWEENESEAAPAPAVKAPVGRAAPGRTTPGRAAVKPKATGESPSIAAALKLVTECSAPKEFMLRAIKVAEIAGDDALMSECMDDTESGFFARNK